MTFVPPPAGVKPALRLVPGDVIAVIAPGAALRYLPVTVTYPRGDGTLEIHAAGARPRVVGAMKGIATYHTSASGRWT